MSLWQKFDINEKYLINEKTDKKLDKEANNVFDKKAHLK